MLKTLHKNDTKISPFVVTKDWELSNISNEDLILMEHDGEDGLPVSLEYIEYGLDAPLTSSSDNCNISMEKQTDDIVLFRDGLKSSGIFYPEKEPINEDGTYKRMVYTQITNMFYNKFRDPTKMWGLEEIDFEKSQTKKFISDKFKMFDVPKYVFGEKMLENSIILYDTTTDNNYVIIDDGNCNLFAGTNLFSHQQEIGNYLNEIITTGSSNGCDYYNIIDLPDSPILSIISSSCVGSFPHLSWDANNWIVENYILERSEDGVNFNYSQSFSSDITSYIDTTVTQSVDEYSYRIYVSNLLRTSSFSNVVSASIRDVTWDTDIDIWDEDKTCGPIYWISSSFFIPLIPDLSGSLVIT